MKHETESSERGNPGLSVSIWVSEMPDDPVGRLAGHGWEAENHPLRERAAAYSRTDQQPAAA